MSDDLIVLPRAELEALREHLIQELEWSGTTEGACIASDAFHRVQEILDTAKPVVAPCSAIPLPGQSPRRDLRAEIRALLEQKP